MIELYDLFSITLFKLLSLLSGVFLAYLGYKLFIKSVWGNAGEFKASHKNISLLLKNAAPGTFFVAFGTVVIVFTIIKGFTIEYENPINLNSHNIIDSIKLPTINQMEQNMEE